MKLGKIKFGPWEIRAREWSRFGNQGAVISVIMIYSNHGKGYKWYPNFYGELSFLRKIYDDSSNRKEFEYNEEKEAMKYVDEFLNRINNLLSFT